MSSSSIVTRVVCSDSPPTACPRHSLGTMYHFSGTLSKYVAIRKKCGGNYLVSRFRASSRARVVSKAARLSTTGVSICAVPRYYFPHSWIAKSPWDEVMCWRVGDCEGMLTTCIEGDAPRTSTPPGFTTLPSDSLGMQPDHVDGSDGCSGPSDTRSRHHQCEPYGHLASIAIGGSRLVCLVSSADGSPTGGSPVPSLPRMRCVNTMGEATRTRAAGP